MYFINKIMINNKGQYVDCEIVDHTSKTISVALPLLETCAKRFINKECGEQISATAKVIDIHDFNQVSEPLIDTMLIYRLVSDPHHLHIYQRKTSIVSGTFYGKSTAIEFNKVKIFSLKEYNKINEQDCAIEQATDPVELVAFGPSKIKIRKEMTMAPMCNIITELKNSKKFKEKLTISNNQAGPYNQSSNLLSNKFVKIIKSNDDVVAESERKFHQRIEQRLEQRKERLRQQISQSHELEPQISAKNMDDQTVPISIDRLRGFRIGETEYSENSQEPEFEPQTSTKSVDNQTIPTLSSSGPQFRIGEMDYSEIIKSPFWSTEGSRSSGFRIGESEHNTIHFVGEMEDGTLIKDGDVIIGKTNNSNDQDATVNQ